MEPPSGLKQESKGTNDDDHTKMDLKYIYGNIFSADFTLDCIHAQPTHISQINNKQSVIYNSSDFSTSNDQILDNKFEFVTNLKLILTIVTNLILKNGQRQQISRKQRR